MTKDSFLKICRIVLSVLLIAKVVYHLIPLLVVWLFTYPFDLPNWLTMICSSSFSLTTFGMISMIVVMGVRYFGFNTLLESAEGLILAIVVLLILTVIVWAAISVLRKRILMPIIAMAPLLFEFYDLIVIEDVDKLFAWKVILLAIHGLMIALLSIYCIDYFREKIKQWKLKKAMADQDVLEQQ